MAAEYIQLSANLALERPSVITLREILPYAVPYRDYVLPYKVMRSPYTGIYGTAYGRISRSVILQQAAVIPLAIPCGGESLKANLQRAAAN